LSNQLSWGWEEVSRDSQLLVGGTRIQIRCISANIHCMSTGPLHLMNSGETLSGPA